MTTGAKGCVTSPDAKADNLRIRIFGLENAPTPAYFREKVTCLKFQKVFIDYGHNGNFPFKNSFYYPSKSLIVLLQNQTVKKITP
jgi:hypothetical protein